MYLDEKYLKKTHIESIHVLAPYLGRVRIITWL